ncbi:MAG: hypothetical protein PHN49_02430 [Candidatus Omnitrophica bacterium]|nr:hypothetical protein [Candidatus Omnitrophota bacterium]MDD5670476.1 hypothetical protein [Candidatus Omnitrophota bacterium]
MINETIIAAILSMGYFLSGDFEGHRLNAKQNTITMINPVAILFKRCAGESQTEINAAPIRISAIRNSDFDMASLRYGSNIMK